LSGRTTGRKQRQFALEVVSLDLLDVETGPLDVVGDVSREMAATRETLLPGSPCPTRRRPQWSRYVMFDEEREEFTTVHCMRVQV
jgi:hypothetical protein